MVSAYSDPKKVNLWTLGKHAGLIDFEADEDEADVMDSLEVLLACVWVARSEFVLCVIPPSAGLVVVVVVVIVEVEVLP